MGYRLWLCYPACDGQTGSGTPSQWPSEEQTALVPTASDLLSARGVASPQQRTQASTTLTTCHRSGKVCMDESACGCSTTECCAVDLGAANRGQGLVSSR